MRFPLAHPNPATLASFLPHAYTWPAGNSPSYMETSSAKTPLPWLTDSTSLLESLLFVELYLGPCRGSHRHLLSQHPHQVWAPRVGVIFAQSSKEGRKNSLECHSRSCARAQGCRPAKHAQHLHGAANSLCPRPVATQALLPLA